jgi:hypothetical protein
MRLAVVITVLLSIAASAAAQGDDAQRDQVQAATATAVAAMGEAIAQHPIGRNLTVRTLLEKTGSSKKLVETLQRAQRIGGPRWVDDQTCQVRLEIAGSRVAAALVQIAASQPDRSPVPADVLAVRLADLNARTFSATGSSTGAAEIENVRPRDESDAWSTVGDEARRKAVASAKQDAINKAIESIAPITLPGGRPAGEALSSPAARQRLADWLAQRPVTEVEFRDDLHVALALATPPSEFYQALRSAVDTSGAGDDAAWGSVREEFERRAGSSVGRALAASSTTQADALKTAGPELPTIPPSWTNDQIDADGVAPAGASKLRAARAAEVDAAEKLAAQLEGLPLGHGTTVGDLARDNPSIRAAVARAVKRARPAKVDYQSEGGVKVHIVMNLRDLWEELRSAR